MFLLYSSQPEPPPKRDVNVLIFVLGTDHAYNRISKKALAETVIPDERDLGKGKKKKLAKAKEKAYVELYDRQERLKKVERLRLHLQAQKNLLVRACSPSLKLLFFV